MKTDIKVLFLLLATLLLMGMTAEAKTNDEKHYAVKAYANIGLGNSLKFEESMRMGEKKASSTDFGVDFGWSFWKVKRHSLTLNMGVGYRAISTTLGINNLDYSYSAPPAADMDGESYIRFYEINALKERNKVANLVIPLYLSYGYQTTNWLRIHADVGLGLGFKVNSKLSEICGEGTSYGVYPQYDNLKIDADYMNDFGQRNYTTEMGSAPIVNSFTASLLAGVGAEFQIFGPLGADISFLYNAGFSNFYKSNIKVLNQFDPETAPMTYCVTGGQKIRSLTDYLKSSKISGLSLKLSLIYNF